MKKSKLRKWLVGIGIFLIVALISGYLVMDYAVNKVLNALAGSSASVSELVGQTEGNEDGKSNPVGSTIKPTPVSTITVQPEQSTPKSTDPTLDSTTGSTDAPVDPKTSATVKPVASPTANSTVLPTKPTASPVVQQSATPYDGTVTPEKAENAEQQISLAEKAQISAVLLRKLTPEDMSLMVKLSSGGMSLEEKREAKKVILQRLTEEEYNSLIALAAKLGLSQGKSYEESLKEFP